jgi:3-isopropylmalate/(R)-2-methylmalate dehydratase small subunit
MIFEGSVHLIGDNQDTDGMIAGRYLSILDPNELAKHLFEEVDPGFRERIKQGDLILAGKNFGSGSGREQAPFALKALGLCVVATSFSRTFYRMGIDLGLPVITCPASVRAAAKQGQKARLDTATSELTLDGVRYQTDPVPKFLQQVVDQGGITNWIKGEVQRRRAMA